MSYAVQQFFHNGGQNALDRALRRRRPARGAAAKASGTRRRRPRSADARGGERGRCGATTCASAIDFTRRRSRPTQFNITVKNQRPARSRCCATSLPGPTLPAAIAAQSQFVRVKGTPPTTRPTRRDPAARRSPFDDPSALTTLRRTRDAARTARSLRPSIAAGAADGTGIYALERADLFNLLVIPPIAHVVRHRGRARAPDADQGAAATLLPRPPGAVPRRPATPTGTSRATSRPAAATPRAPTSGHRQRRPAQRGALLPVPARRPTRCRATSSSSSRRAARSPASSRAPTPTRGVWKAPAGLDAGARRRRRSSRSS